MNLIPTIALTLCASSLLAVEEGADWFPPPDGFKWPAHSRIQLSKEREIKTADLSQNERQAFEESWPDDQLPAVLHVREADLNNDRKPEVFLNVPILSGTGGPFYEILTREKDGFRSIGGVQGGIFLCEGRSGWLRIEGGSRAGGGQYTRYLLEYRNGQYEEVRNEGHNYTTGKVEIRKTEVLRGTNPPTPAASGGGSR